MMEDEINADNLSFLESVELSPREKMPLSEGGRLERAIRLYRQEGHLFCHVNPLEERPLLHKRYSAEGLGFSQEEQKALYPTMGLCEEPALPLSAILSSLQAVYADRMGIEYLDLVTEEIAAWIQERFERLAGRIPLGKEQKKMIYKQLVQAEGFELFLHTKYVGQKRFSLEGSDTLIPALAFLLERAAQLGSEKVVLGMAHRGRLNVMANILEKPIEQLLAEFEDQTTSVGDVGDVKYHKGYTASITTLSGRKLAVSLVANPSHLESVDAVVEGYARGLQRAMQDTAQEKIVPILIHGDASLSGQGVVYETLQLSRLPGYSTGGTVHFVINNQIGFTTDPRFERSTRYCTDIAKSFGFPVFHVNAEDPEACVWATISALELRNRFHVDVFVSLYGYRKHGHNESDEPAFTQPAMYALIKQKQTIKTIYKEKLIQEGFSEQELTEYEQRYREKLDAAFTKRAIINELSSPEEVVQSALVCHLDELRQAASSLYHVPAGFSLHPRVQKVIEERISQLSKKDDFLMDWSFAETLACITILREGIYLRLTGQDSGRGTFSQRHAVWVDQKTARTHIPLACIKPGTFEVIDSLLSEYAALAFEYGFSIAHPQTLAIWEAQFGDFANGAQIVIDQYIASGEKKWGAISNLTLLLPHGYEGQGPEHSSARIERFLSLCAENNLTVATPTTPAQYFHLLVRQATRKKPLVVFTPKGLLRHPECKSHFSLCGESFQEVILNAAKEKTQQVLICQGRIYYDIVQAMKQVDNRSTAIVRIEQLYPFPSQSVKNCLPQAKRYIFVQEEPENAGAYIHLRDEIQRLLPKECVLAHIGRAASASPAVGSHSIHEQEHANILRRCFNN